MRGRKIGLGVIVVIGLLAGSAGRVAAQDADEGVAEPTLFTVQFIPSVSSREPEVSTEDGVYKEIGSCFAPIVVNPSDPRLDGVLTACGDFHQFGPSEGSPTVGSGTYRLVNDEGAWQGSSPWAGWTDPESGDAMELGDEVIVLTGEGAYDGLYAVMTLSDWSDIRGFIFNGAPPADPVPPPDK